MLQQVNKENFENTIKNNEIVLLDFYADWCGPCKALHPTLEQLADEFGNKAVIAKVDVDKNPELSNAFGVRSIPALFYFKNGELVGKQAGLQSHAVIANQLDHLLEKAA
ncbi:MAG: thioredoxin [Bacteroidota bacterium]